MARDGRVAKTRLFVLALLLLCLLGIAILWALHGPADAEGIAGMFLAMRFAASDLPAWEAIAFVFLASVVAIPLGVITVASALLFGPLTGAVYTLLGATCGATASYGIGNYLGHEGLYRFAGERINRISLSLSRRGMLAVVVIRMLPIAPFAIVNMIAGASHLRVRDFIPGTMLGMLPGTFLISFSLEYFRYVLLE